MDLTLLFLAAAPISECRGAIIYGLAQGFKPQLVWLYSILLNLAIIPISFLILEKTHFRELIFKLYGGKIRKKIENNKKLLSYGEIGLIPFVAIPFPGTGAYTGILIAEALGFNKQRSQMYISIGVVIAATLVFLTTTGILLL